MQGYCFLFPFRVLAARVLTQQGVQRPKARQHAIFKIFLLCNDEQPINSLPVKNFLNDLKVAQYRRVSRLRAGFRRLDLDGNGFVTRDEVRALAERVYDESH